MLKGVKTAFKRKKSEIKEKDTSRVSDTNVKVFKPVQTFKIYLCIMVAIMGTFNILFFNAKVPTSSMMSTIQPSDRLLGLRFAYWFKGINRGDIVIFKTHEENAFLVKRVIGIPGDKVDIKDGYVYVNDVKLDERYVYSEGATSKGKLNVPFVVPDGRYFLLGDNRANSFDGRFWSDPFIDEKDIVAEAALIYFPFSRFKVIN